MTSSWTIFKIIPRPQQASTTGQHIASVVVVQTGLETEEEAQEVLRRNESKLADGCLYEIRKTFSK